MSENGISNVPSGLREDADKIVAIDRELKPLKESVKKLNDARKGFVKRVEAYACAHQDIFRVGVPVRVSTQSTATVSERKKKAPLNLETLTFILKSYFQGDAKRAEACAQYILSTQPCDVVPAIKVADVSGSAARGGPKKRKRAADKQCRPDEEGSSDSGSDVDDDTRR